MRSLVLLLTLMALGGCMNVSDMGEGVRYHMSDAGLLDHSDTTRTLSIRLQPDSFIFIGQGAFVPPGKGPVPRQNAVAEEAFKSFVEYFPLVRRGTRPPGAGGRDRRSPFGRRRLRAVHPFRPHRRPYRQR